MGATRRLAARALGRLTTAPAVHRVPLDRDFEDEQEIMAVVREIVGFGEDDALVFSQEFPEEKMEDLRPLFDHGDDEQMYAGSYEVTAGNRDRVAAILGVQLRPGIAYYIEASET